LPDPYKIPLRGLFDLNWEFRFPVHPGGKLDLKNKQNCGCSTTLFEYEKYSLGDLDSYFNMNYNHFVAPLFDKEFGLQMLREDWRLMNIFSVQTIDKLCKRAHLSTQAVLDYLGKNTP